MMSFFSSFFIKKKAKSGGEFCLFFGFRQSMLDGHVPLYMRRYPHGWLGHVKRALSGFFSFFFFFFFIEEKVKFKRRRSGANWLWIHTPPTHLFLHR